MAEVPTNGRIVIEWQRVGDDNDEALTFDWRVKLEPPGLSDEDVSRLLAEISERF